MAQQGRRENAGKRRKFFQMLAAAPLTSLYDFSHDTKETQVKTMTCKQLGGACDKEFRANTFEEIAELSKQHGMEMHQKQDAEHLAAMNEMQKLMKEPDQMNQWIESKRQEFEDLPEG